MGGSWRASMTRPQPRRPHDVIAVPGGRSGEREVRRGPHATAKWLTGSVACDAKEVIRAAFDQAEARDRQHVRTWVVLVDGDRHQIELVEAEAGRRNAAIHLVIDLVHMLEYLWAAAWCFHARDDPAAEDWVAVQALARPGSALPGHRVAVPPKGIPRRSEGPPPPGYGGRPMCCSGS